MMAITSRAAGDAPSSRIIISPPLAPCPVTGHAPGRACIAAYWAAGAAQLLPAAQSALAPAPRPWQSRTAQSLRTRGTRGCAWGCGRGSRPGPAWPHKQAAHCTQPTPAAAASPATGLSATACAALLRSLVLQPPPTGARMPLTLSSACSACRLRHMSSHCSAEGTVRGGAAYWQRCHYTLARPAVRCGVPSPVHHSSSAAAPHPPSRCA